MQGKGIKDGNKAILETFFMVYGFLVILLIPVVFVPGIADPVQPVRLLALGIVTFGFLSALLLREKSTRFRLIFLKDRVITFFLFYILFVAISIFFAGNPREGFFDLVKTILSFFTLTIIVYLLLRDPSRIRILVKMVILAGLLFSLTGLAQYFIHVAGKTGNAMYAALYLVKGFSGHKVAYSTMLFLSLPFSIYGMFIFKRIWKVLAIGVVFLAFCMILIAQTRAIWIGICVSVSAAVLFGGYYRSWKGGALFAAKLRLVFLTVFAVALIGIAYYAVSPGFRKVVNYQVGGLTDANRSNNLPRLSIMDATFDMYLDHAFTGVGAGNWKIQIPPYQYDYEFYMMDEFKPEVRFQNWLRPHNDLIWVLSEKGPLGLLAFLGIFLFFFLAGSRAVFMLQDKNLVLLVILIMITALGYLAISLVSFPLERIDNQVYLMILIGVVLSLKYMHETENGTSGPMFRKYYLFPALIVAAGILGYSALLLKSEFDLASFLAGRVTANDPSRKEKALRTNSSVAPLDAFANPVKYYMGIHEVKKNKPNVAMEYFRDACIDHPNNINLLYSLSTIYLKSGDIDRSIHYSNELLRIFPFHPDGQMNLAVAFFMDGRYERSFQTLLSIKEKNPAVEKAIRKTAARLNQSNES